MSAEIVLWRFRSVTASSYDLFDRYRRRLAHESTVWKPHNPTPARGLPASPSAGEGQQRYTF